jgi:hypothetical protein
MGPPVNDDGGLVVLTSDSTVCLTCVHTASCSHVHAAGAAVDRSTRRLHHTTTDMQRYLHLVHETISPDGLHLRLHGSKQI